VFTPIVNGSAGMDFNANISNVLPVIPLENPTFSMLDMDTNNLLLTLFALLPSDSVAHATPPSPPLEFATHVFEDNGILSSKWDFQDLISLMPATVTNNPATTSPQPSISQGQPSSTEVATGLGTSGHQPLSNANFINFPLVGHRDINLEDKRTLGVCTSNTSNIALMLI
jgi:hypothetical protein